METYPARENHFDSLEHYDTIFALHEELLERENIVGFNELLLFAKQNAHRFKNSFQEIIIDEYQDTSFLQTEYIEALSFKQLFCVGDYDQSIYAFNGADITIIGSFKNQYPQASVINLKKNYRSHKPILELAQKSLAINERLFPKELEVMKTDDSIPVEHKIYTTAEEQYEGIANEIKNSFRNFNEIAVLYRNNSSADKIEVELKALDINVIRDDKSSFFEIDEV